MGDFYSNSLNIVATAEQSRQQATIKADASIFIAVETSSI
jgi:hypothetical protein